MLAFALKPAQPRAETNKLAAYTALVVIKPGGALPIKVNDPSWDNGFFRMNLNGCPQSHPYTTKPDL